MAWQTPITTWGQSGQTVPSDADFNRIEGNTLELKTALGGHESNSGTHVKPARIVIGTSTAGWTAKDCHYLCDGTDDQVEINSAIQSMTSGGELLILEGTYNISTKISVSAKSGLTIRGSGYATQLRRRWNSTVDEGVITVTNGSECKIENLQINGNKTTYQGHGIYLDTSHRCLIENCYVSGCSSQGIYIKGGNNNSVIANRCVTSTYGIRLESTEESVVTNNICYSNSFGIHLDYYADRNVITDNVCNDNGVGISLNASSENIIKGNVCSDNSDGIFLSMSGYRNTICDNNLCRNSYNGIFLNYSWNNSITGNTVSDCGNGVVMEQCDQNSITGNTFRNNGNDIKINESNTNTISGNTCYGFSVSGITLVDNCKRNNITGNTCIRGTGTPDDYDANQFTIDTGGLGNMYNLVSSNNIMGKQLRPNNTLTNTYVNNKFE